jgi:hypothetical protein
MAKKSKTIEQVAFYLSLVWIGFMLRWSMEIGQSSVFKEKLMRDKKDNLEVLKAEGDKKAAVPAALNSPQVADTGRSLIEEKPAIYSAYSSCFRRMKGRSDLSFLMNDLQLVGEGVEIGVKEGEFAIYTLSKWKGRKLHLVDPWLQQDAVVYNDISNSPQSEQDQRFASVSKEMEQKFPGRYQIHRNLSTDAATHFADLSLDYIYIDARYSRIAHSYRLHRSSAQPLPVVFLPSRPFCCIIPNGKQAHPPLSGRPLPAGTTTRG